PEAFAEFGGSVSAGDLNGDGFRDLVIGARHKDVPPAVDAGDVTVYFGPDYVATRKVRSPTPELVGRFGHWTACGDFDGDGIDDLAVGSIGATANGFFSAGVVHVFFGPSLG